MRIKPNMQRLLKALRLQKYHRHAGIFAKMLRANVRAGTHKCWVLGIFPLWQTEAGATSRGVLYCSGCEQVQTKLPICQTERRK